MSGTLRASLSAPAQRVEVDGRAKPRASQGNYLPLGALPMCINAKSARALTQFFIAAQRRSRLSVYVRSRSAQPSEPQAALHAWSPSSGMRALWVYRHLGNEPDPGAGMKLVVAEASDRRFLAPSGVATVRACLKLYCRRFTGPPDS